MSRFALSDGPIDGAALERSLRSRATGAVVSFAGWVRDHNDGRAVRALTYQVYAPLAASEGNAIMDEARQRFDVLDARCVHRIGDLMLGDCAVWVGASAAHRDVAFAACRWIIDEIKQRVPIWKNEHYADGESGWLHPDDRSRG